MAPEPRVLPFRWIFPLAQLFLCAVILWPMRSMLVGQIRASLREYGISHDTTPRNPITTRLRPFNLDLSDPDVQRRIRISEAREWAVAALNMPGGLPDMAYAILSPAHSEWIPRGMFMWAWRDLSWPIVGIFFWCLAGRSIEALLFSRHKILLPKIRWWEVVVSLPVLAFGAILAVGLCISQSALAEFPFWMLLSVLGSTWLVLGASTSLAYFVQWRLRRRLASSTAEQPRLLTSTS
jgi:hypothetical protein